MATSMTTHLQALLLALALSALQAPSVPRKSNPSAPVQDYVIGPEDIVKITVYGHEDLTQTIVVQPDGTFVYPLIGRVKASDMTPKELEKKLAVLLSQGFIRNPQVTVVVQEYRSQTIFVVGEVARPGAYPLPQSRTVIEAIARAGPTTPGAAAEAIIIRPRSAVSEPVLPSDLAVDEADSNPSKPRKKAEVIRVNIRDIQAGDLEKNILLMPNDTLFIPQAPRVYLSGEVRNPGAYPFAPGMTVRQTISLAGGFTEAASSGRIRVIREVGSQSKEAKIKLDDHVQPGDTIIVKAKWF